LISNRNLPAFPVRISDQDFVLPSLPVLGRKRRRGLLPKSFPDIREFGKKMRLNA
jgi:hypothetical protein